VEEYKILVIDDETSIRMSLKDYLEDEGYDVTIAESGEEALEHVKKNKFDVAIVDIRLPGIDGNIFIEKAYKLSPETYYLIHTGSVQFSLSTKLKDIGVQLDDILYKPLRDLNIMVVKKV